jgi:glycosyltransferase involved in cell wall biosynthesis
MSARILIYESGLGKGGSRRSLLSWLDFLNKDSCFELILFCGQEGWFSKQLSQRMIPHEILHEPSGLSRIRHSMLRQPVNVLWLTLTAVPQLLVVWTKLLSLNVDAIVLTHPRDFIMLFPLVIKHRKNSVIIPQTTDWSDVPLARLACQIVKEVWAISNTVAESIAQMGIPWDKIRVLPLIFVRDISSDRPSKSSLRNEFGIPSDAKVLGITGTIRMHKGQREALEVFAVVKEAIPEAVLVIVGSPFESELEEKKYYQSLLSRVTELNLSNSVFFLGWREDAHQVMSTFDIYLMPSQSTEGVPRVVLEALESSLPVIGSNIPAIRELLETGKVGFLAPPNDIEKWAELVISILENPNYLEKISYRARAVWSDYFSENVSIPKLQSSFKEITY